MRDSIWFTIQKPAKSPANSEDEDSDDEGGDLSALTPVELDVQRFEDLFCVAPPSAGARTAKKAVEDSAPKEPQAVSLLDSRRAQNISIGAAMFKRMRGLGAVEVRKALGEFDEQALSAEDCIALEPLLPTPEERSLIQGYLTQTSDTEGHKLSPPDQFLAELMKDPNVPHYVAGFIFRGSLAIEPKQIEDDLVTVIDACGKLRKSDTLRRVVIAARDIGNLTNCGSSLERAIVCLTNSSRFARHSLRRILRPLNQPIRPPPKESRRRKNRLSRAPPRRQIRRR
jgi:hypothetical protein